MVNRVLSSLIAIFCYFSISFGFESDLKGCIEVPFEKTDHEEYPGLIRRLDPSNFRLTNDIRSYIIYLAFGKERQTVGLALDLAANEVLVPRAGKHSSWIYGSYDPEVSTTSAITNSKSYLPTYWRDTIAMRSGSHDISIQNFRFGIIEDGKYGTLGMGPNANFPETESFINHLKSQGSISSKSFSIFVNSDSSTKGSVIFGGIDTAKIDGKLVELPMTSKTQPLIKMDSITIKDQIINIDADTLLDTGIQTASFPKQVADALLENYDTAIYNADVGAYLVNSDLGRNQSVTLNFNGVAIEGSFYNAFRHSIVDRNGKSYGPGYLISHSDKVILGDLFISKMYVVFNYDTRTISIGRARYTAESTCVPV